MASSRVALAKSGGSTVHLAVEAESIAVVLDGPLDVSDEQHGRDPGQARHQNAPDPRGNGQGATSAAGKRARARRRRRRPRRARPDDHRRARSRRSSRRGRPRAGRLADGREQGRVRRAVGLVEAVVERGGEELSRAARDRGAEECGAPGRVGRVDVRHLIGKRLARGLRPDSLVGDQRDRLCGQPSAMRAIRPSQVRQTPPASAAARLSGCPSRSTPRRSSSSGSSSRPATSAPATRPSATVAALEPSPRSRGIRSVKENESPSVGCSARERLEREVVRIGLSVV